MTYDHTIKPTTINILGSSPRTATPSRSPYKFDMEGGPTCRQSLLQWVKSGVKKACRYVHQALSYIKENVAPIIIATAGLLNAWTNYRRCTGNARDAVCYA